MNSAVLATVQKYNMLEQNDSVVVALSGGADSVSLLDIIISFKEIYNLTVYAAHVNHMIRGKEADGDENFCRLLCKKYNVELFVKSIDVKALAKQQKISEELCGRNVRYDFFEELSKKLNAKVATAHTASDNAETLLFNIARGTSVSGLCGIVPCREYIIRPLIETTRVQVEDYCKNNNLEYVTDSTNLDDEYTRNKIRHHLIPVLKQINPQFEKSAVKLTENMREIKDCIDFEANKAIELCKTNFGYDCKKLEKLSKAVLCQAIGIICKDNGVKNLEQKHISLIIDIISNGGAVNLCGGYKAIAKQNVLRIAGKNNSVTEEKKYAENIKFVFDCKEYSVKEINVNSDTELKNCISAKLNLENAVFRTRRQGDSFTLYKRNITKPLRKIMNEMKIPSETRDKILVLAIDSTVLWCENIGASKQGHCKNNSDKALKIDIIGETGNYNA